MNKVLQSIVHPKPQSTTSNPLNHQIKSPQARRQGRKGYLVKECETLLWIEDCRTSIHDIEGGANASKKGIYLGKNNQPFEELGCTLARPLPSSTPSRVRPLPSTGAMMHQSPSLALNWQYKFQVPSSGFILISRHTLYHVQLL